MTFSADGTTGIITVTDVTAGGHGAVLGDYVTFSAATSLGGDIIADVLNHEYRIDNVTSSSTYTFIALDTSGNPVLSTGADTGDGLPNTVAKYQINIGTNSYIASTGWGAGAWGAGPWGGGGSLSFAGQLRLYSQDEFGDDLIFNPRA